MAALKIDPETEAGREVKVPYTLIIQFIAPHIDSTLYTEGITPLR
jgi:hypothetical protein